MSAAAETLPALPVAAAEPWRRRLLRSLLYGRNVNRTAKARARVGLAIVAFAIVGKATDWLIVLAAAPFLRWEDVVAHQ